MIYIFYFISSIGIFYFFLTKRYFDFFSIAYFSALIYFMPGFFGYVGFESENTITTIVPKTYIIFISVLLSIVVFAFIYDLSFSKQPIKNKIFEYESKYFGYIGLIISFISLLIIYTHLGNSFFTASKAEILSLSNQWMTLFEFSSSLSAIFFFIQKKYFLTLVAFLFLFVDIYLGMRTAFALTFISIVTIYLNNLGQIRLIQFWKKILLFSFVIIFLFVIKLIWAQMRIGNIHTLLSFDIILKSFEHSEPFATQRVLNEIIIQNFESSIDHLLGIVALIIPFYTKIAQVTSFNDIFQPILFPNIDYGMGNNIWGEMWSMGGWFLLLDFILFFNFILLLGSRLLFTTSLHLKTLYALVFSYWAFYIHRNDILYQITLEKRALVVYLILLLFSLVVYKLSRLKIQQTNEDKKHGT